MMKQHSGKQTNKRPALKVQTSIKAGGIVACTPGGECTTVEGGGPDSAQRRQPLP